MTDAFAFVKWLRTRPESVQRLAVEFPIGSTFEVHGRRHWLIGYTEDDELLLTPIDPRKDYDGAHEARVPACADHFRGGPKIIGFNNPPPVPLADILELRERMREHSDPIQAAARRICHVHRESG